MFKYWLYNGSGQWIIEDDKLGRFNIYPGHNERPRYEVIFSLISFYENSGQTTRDIVANITAVYLYLGNQYKWLNISDTIRSDERLIDEQISKKYYSCVARKLERMAWSKSITLKS